MKTEQKCNPGENRLVEMNILMQKNDPVIFYFLHTLSYGMRCHADQQDYGQ